MKLSQRLTRAGLTFILLGSVAAVMPQQNQAVRADACNPDQSDFVLVQGALQETKTPSTITGSFVVPAGATLATAGQINGESDLSPSSTNFLRANDANFPARTLAITINNTGTSGSFFFGGVGAATAGTEITPGASGGYPAATIQTTQYGLRLRKSGTPTGTLIFDFMYNGLTAQRILTLS